MPETIRQQITNVLDIIRQGDLFNRYATTTQQFHTQLEEQINAMNEAQNEPLALSKLKEKLSFILGRKFTQSDYDVDTQACDIQLIFFNTINQHSNANLVNSLAINDLTYLAHKIPDEALQALFDRNDCPMAQLLKISASPNRHRNNEWFKTILPKLRDDQLIKALTTYPAILLKLASMSSLDAQIKNTCNQLLSNNKTYLSQLDDFYLLSLIQYFPNSIITQTVLQSMNEEQLIDKLTHSQPDGFSALQALMNNPKPHLDTLNLIWNKLKACHNWPLQFKLLTHRDKEDNSFITHFAQQNSYYLQETDQFLLSLDGSSKKIQELWGIQHTNGQSFLAQILQNTSKTENNQKQLNQLAKNIINKLRDNISDTDYYQLIHSQTQSLNQLINTIEANITTPTRENLINQLLVYPNSNKPININLLPSVANNSTSSTNNDTIKQLIPYIESHIFKCQISQLNADQQLQLFGQQQVIRLIDHHCHMPTFINTLYQTWHNLNNLTQFAQNNQQALRQLFNYIIDVTGNNRQIQRLLSAQRGNNSLNIDFKPLFDEPCYQPQSFSYIYLTQKLIPIVKPDTLSTILSWYSEEEQQFKVIGGEQGLVQLAIHGKLDQVPHLLQKCLEDKHSQQRLVDSCARHSESFLVLCQRKNPQAYAKLTNNGWCKLTDHNKQRLLTTPQTHYASSFIRQQWGRVIPSQSLDFIRQLLPKDTGLALATLAPFFNSFSDKAELTDSQYNQAVAVYKHLILPLLFNQISLTDIAHQSPRELIQAQAIDHCTYHYLSCPFAKDILKDTIKSIHQDNTLQHKQSNQITQYMHSQSYPTNTNYQTRSLFYDIVHQRRYTLGSMGEYGHTETFNLLKQLNNNPHKFFQNGPDPDNEGNTMELQEFHNGNLPRDSFSSNNSSPSV